MVTREKANQYADKDKLISFKIWLDDKTEKKV